MKRLLLDQGLPRSTPALAAGRLYVGEGLHEDADCRLYCLEAATGRELWSFAARSHVESSPRVAGGRVFFDHLHFYWLNHGSTALQGTANYIGVGSKLPMPITGIVNTTFPKGNSMADWLVMPFLTK